MDYKKSDLVKYDTHEHHNHLKKNQGKKYHQNHYDTQGVHYDAKGNHYDSCNLGSHKNNYDACNLGSHKNNYDACNLGSHKNNYDSCNN